MKPLTQVLADTRSELPVLRKHGSGALADAIERLCDEIAEAASPFTEYLNEQQAMLRCNKSATWLRRRHPEWERQGLARTVPGGHREYLKVVIPMSLDVDAVQADARLAAARDAA